MLLPPVPSPPPRRSPGTLPSSSRPSPYVADWWNPPRPVRLSAPTSPQIGIRLKVGLVSEEYLGPSPCRRCYQRGVLRHECLPPLRVRLDPAASGDASAQTPTGAGSSDNCSGSASNQTLPYQLPHRLPVPVGPVDARLRRQTLHRHFQLLAFAPRPTRGEPPVCSKTSASGPPWAKALTHWPMVWASRSKALPTLPPSSLGQQPHRVPPLPFSGRRRSVHPTPRLSLVQAPLLQQPRPSLSCPSTPSNLPNDCPTCSQFYPIPMWVSPSLRFS